jgi:transketolase
LHTSGLTAFEALCAAKILWKKHKISVSVIHHGTIKPIDAKTIVKSAERKKLILSIEDHQIIGGLGSSIAEVLAENAVALPFKRLGVNDVFGESGSYAELYKKHGIDANAIVKTVLSSLKKKK